MARAQGARAQMALGFETVYGTPPVSGFRLMPFARTTLGSEQPLLESELLGYGRDPLAPIKDAVTADGDVVVPIDVEAFGYRGSPRPLHLLIDSTGIKVEGEGEWNARKHGGTKRRVWRKIHIGIDEHTLEIWAAEFTTGNAGDAPMLLDLLDQISPGQEIASVTADGAFDTRKCHDVIAARGAAAVIPPRKNARPWKPDTPGAIARNEALRASRRFGRTIWRRWSGYHRRSRVETKMHCVKLLGQRLTARDFDRQVAEFQIRVAVLNGFTALGIPVTEAVG